MSEATEEPNIDLDQLRDDVLAGKETGYGGPASDTRPPHIINPEEHPELQGRPDPDIGELKRIAEERRKRQSEKSDPPE